MGAIEHIYSLNAVDAILSYGISNGFDFETCSRAVDLFHEDETYWAETGWPGLFRIAHRQIWEAGIVPPGDGRVGRIGNAVWIDETRYSVVFLGPRAGWEVQAWDTERQSSGPICNPVQTREEAERALDAVVG